MTKSLDNYNLDAHKVLKQKMKSWKFWLAVLIGIAVCYGISLLFGDSHTTTFVGLVFCYVVLLLIAVPMLGFDQSALVQLAAKKGWQYIPAMKLQNGLPLRQAKLFDAGSNRTLHGFLQGTINQNWGLQIFRYSFEYKAQATNNLYQFTTVALKTPVQLPQFIIDTGQLYDFERFIVQERTDPIRLEGSFGDKYKVYVSPSTDNEARLLALSTLSPDFMALYEDWFGGCNMIVEGTSIVILTQEDLYYEQKIDRLVEGIEKIAPKLARQATIRANVGSLS